MVKVILTFGIFLHVAYETRDALFGDDVPDIFVERIAIDT